MDIRSEKELQREDVIKAVQETSFSTEVESRALHPKCGSVLIRGSRLPILKL